MELERLIEILEASAHKHGENKVLTIGHLLNILKKAKKEYESDDFYGHAGDYEDCF